MPTKNPHQIEAARLAAMAAQLIEAGDIHSACWRLADAGALLRLALEDAKADTEPHHVWLCGFNEPTGRGALLPTVRAA